MSEIHLPAGVPPHHQHHTHRPRHKARWAMEILKFLGLFASIFVVLSLIVMGPTIYAKFSYDPKSAATKSGLPTSVESDTDAINNLVSFVDKNAEENKADSIVIPKIGIDAPIVYPTKSDNVSILDAIKDGVAHYPDSAFPGHVGNVFITGHSSYYWWSGGKYNNVFALLDKLQTGDLIYAYYKGNKYIYRVSGSRVVSPTQVDVLDATTKPTMSLMTCTPVGTNLRRLIVSADLIGSPPVESTDFTPFQQIPRLPVILPLY